MCVCVCVCVCVCDHNYLKCSLKKLYLKCQISQGDCSCNLNHHENQTKLHVSPSDPLRTLVLVIITTQIGS